MLERRSSQRALLETCRRRVSFEKVCGALTRAAMASRLLDVSARDRISDNPVDCAQRWRLVIVVRASGRHNKEVA